MQLKDGYGSLKGWVVAVLGILAIVLFVVFSLGLVAFFDYKGCKAREEIKGYDYEWDFYAGCVYRGVNEDQTVEIVR